MIRGAAANPLANIRINLLRDHVKPQASCILGRINKAALGLAFSSLVGCTGEIVTADLDGKSKFINDAGQSCLLVDDFRDGNLVSENTGLIWTAVPGTNLVSLKDILRAEGHRTQPDSYMGVLLKLQTRPYADQEFDTLFFELRAGRVDLPNQPAAGKLKIEINGNSSLGIITIEGEKDFSSPRFADQSFVFDTGLLGSGYDNASLNSIGFYLKLPDDAQYFMEIRNVRFCSTGWPINY